LGKIKNKTLGIFKTLFDLRLKAHNRPLEDYLTEIISFVLSSDLEILNDFLIQFGIVENQIETYNITTQLVLKRINNHTSDSRPDMAIFLENKAIFFENKINSKEGFKQLKRYAEHLDQITDEKKTLVYLTKHYDLKNPEKIFTDCKSDIELIQIRWHKIYGFFTKYKSDPIVFELLLFMKQINLSMNNQFNPSDIITLTNFTNVREMMDETMFGAVSKKFKQINKGISQKSASMTQLRDHDRYIYYRSHKEKMWCGLGYWMNSRNEKDYPDVGIVIEVAPQSSLRKEIISTFQLIVSENKSWKGYSLSNPKAWAGIRYGISLQSFLSEDSQTEKIKEFFIKGLEEMEEIFEKNEKLPTNK
tara:strand:- start:623 stop:1705 length:1083 start_codon:yes stop_codon:yes gene_type:complete